MRDATTVSTEDQAAIEGFLRSSPLFSSLSDDARKMLARVARSRNVGKGETIIAEGEDGDAFFVIKSGEVGIKTMHEGKPVPLAKLTPGEFFGEVALLTGRPRTATCVALSDARIYEFKRDELEPFFKSYPDTVTKLRSKISERSEDTIRKLYG